MSELMKHEWPDEELLEHVSGGLKPVLDDFVPGKASCVKCRKQEMVSETVYQSRLINGEYYCSACMTDLI